MMAEARNAQWSPLAFLGKGSIRVVAPAKVNLFLGVGGKREDGYHDVTTIMHALALHDTLYLNCMPTEGSNDAAPDAESEPMVACGPADSLNVAITISDKTAGLGRVIEEPLEIPVSQNLVFKAIDALSHAAGHQAPQTIRVHIEKQIPSQAGLGGGSADAAAALVGLAHFWEISDDELLMDVAAGLGSDVAFFLKGGCGLYTGGGEAYQHELAPFSQPLVLVRPPVGVPTKAAYEAFDLINPALPGDLLARACEATEASQVPLFNNLTDAAHKVAPELAEVHEWLAQELTSVKAASSGVGGHNANLCGPLLTGSGSALFALTESFAQASQMAAEAQARGWWARATTFSKLRALIVEAQR